MTENIYIVTQSMLLVMSILCMTLTMVACMKWRLIVSNKIMRLIVVAIVVNTVGAIVQLLCLYVYLRYGIKL